MDLASVSAVQGWIGGGGLPTRYAVLQMAHFQFSILFAELDLEAVASYCVWQQCLQQCVCVRLCAHASAQKISRTAREEDEEQYLDADLQ